MASIWGELKRRNVVKVAAAYAIVGWLLVEIASTVLPTFEAPQWALQTITFAIILGFPLAIILAWAFDITPDGLKAASATSPTESVTHSAGHKLTYISQALILLAVGFLVLDQYVLQPRVITDTADGSTEFVKRFEHELPAGQSFRNTQWILMALSPDGRQFVYNTRDGLYVRTMDELQSRLIPGTESSLVSPTFSPDGQWVAYYDTGANQLKRIAISGGTPIVITAVPGTVRGLSWEVDDTILIGQTDGVLRVSARGGTPDLVIPTEEGELVQGPRLLPDGDTVLFSIAPVGQWDAAEIVAQSLTTGKRTVLIEGGNDARYVPTGHLVYALGADLFAVAFDPVSLRLSGAAVSVVQGVLRSRGIENGVADYGISADGTLVYVPRSDTSAARTLVWVDSLGREESINVPPRLWVSPRISPDGSQLALNARDANLDIWIWSFDRGTLQRLTNDPGADTFPVWWPDSSRIVFSSSRESGSENDTTLFSRLADGSGVAERLAQSDGQIFPESFLPDSNGILVYGATEAGSDNDDISIFRLDGEQRVMPLLKTTFRERNPVLSPDGGWLAYGSDSSGREEIYVRPWPDVNSGTRTLVSTGGGEQPLWSRDGTELFYRSGQKLLSVRVETDPIFEAGTPEEVVDGDYLVTASGGRSYDVSFDGEEFLMIKQAGETAETDRIIIVLNWTDELNRLAPSVEQSR